MTPIETGGFSRNHGQRPYVVQYDDAQRHFKFTGNTWWRSTDGGASFASQGAIFSDVSNNYGCDTWYGRWNVNAPTDLIYIVGMYDDGNGDFVVRFRTFNPATAAFGTQVDVYGPLTGQGAAGSEFWRQNLPGVNRGYWVSIVRTEHGDGDHLALYWAHRADPAGNTVQFLTSDDNGATWTSQTPHDGAGATSCDRADLFPSLHSADPDDIYAVINYVTNNDYRLLEWDHSATGWTDQGTMLVATGNSENNDVIRHTAVFDRATGDIYACIYFAFGQTDYGVAAGHTPWEIWKWDGAALSKRSDFRDGLAGQHATGIYISPNNGDLYMGYAPEDSSTNSIRYMVSSDKGATFGAEVVVEDPSDATIGRISWIGFIPGFAGQTQPYISWRMELGNASHNTPETLITEEEGGDEPEPEPIPGVPAFVLCDFGYEFDELIDPTGAVFRLSDGVSKHLLVEAGTGLPPTEYLTQRAPYLDGEQLFDFRLQTRSVRQRYRMRGRHRRDRWGLYGFVLNALRPNRQVSPWQVVEPLRLRKYLPDGSRWDLHVFPDLAAFGQRQRQGMWDEWSFDEPIRFVAHDPVYYDPDTTVATLTDDDEQLVLGDDAAGIAGGMDFEPGERIWFGGGLQANVVYDGNWFAQPVIELTGPVTDPILTNDAIQERIALDYALEAGEVVTIDTRDASRSIVSGKVGSITGLATNPSALATFRLEPDPTAPDGENPIRLFGGDQVDGQTGVTVRYQRRKIALGQ